MTRETYGVRIVNRLSLILFLCQTIGVFASVVLLIRVYRPPDAGIVFGVHMAFPLLFPLAPIMLAYFLWKEENFSLALGIGWAVASLLFAFGFHGEMINHLDEQSAIGYQVGMISFALPAVLYVVTVLIHYAARIKKYGIQKESVYRGD